MKMLEAFKALLDGEKITRKDWGDVYLAYDKKNNIFKKVDKCELRLFMIATFSQTENKTCISLSDSVGEWVKLELLDDDKNEIWESPQERMELDAMKWRLSRYCCGRVCTEADCKIYKPGIGCPVAPWSDLADISSKEVKRLYDLIKEDN